MYRFLFLLLLGLMYGTSALADTTLTYQGRLEQSDVPINGQIEMGFQLFTAADGGTTVGPSLLRNALIDRGLFTVDLDFGNQPFDSGLWLQIEVDGELLAPRQRLAATPVAVRSLDSASLQTGVDALLQRMAAVEAASGQLRSEMDSLAAISAAQANTIGVLQNELAAADASIDLLQSLVDNQSTTLSSLNARTGALEAKTAALTIVGDDLLLVGVNLHLRSGSGSTDGAANGRGNLIIGYNEADVEGSLRSGSHNLVMGFGNSYTSHGGIVGGSRNRITAPFASVLSGELNQATGAQSVIASGYEGTAAGQTAVILTGYQSLASGLRSAVISGWQNQARGGYSSVLGGDGNIAVATDSSIGGGDDISATTAARFSAEGTFIP